MLETLLVGPNGKPAQVLNGGALEVIDDGLPAFGQEQKGILYTDFFKDSAGSSALNVDGSITPVEFTIEGSKNTDIPADRYITAISFLIQDTGIRLGDRFGGLAQLTNGINLQYSNLKAEGGAVSLDNGGITTNFELVRVCLGNPAFTGASNAFIADFTGAESALFPVLDVGNTGLKNGILLRNNSDDNIKITVNDNLTGLTIFNVVAYGYDRVKVGD